MIDVLIADDHGIVRSGLRMLIERQTDMRVIAEAEDDATRDALMIAAAQKVEHYEIASYGTIRVWANQVLSRSATVRAAQTFATGRSMRRWNTMVTASPSRVISPRSSWVIRVMGYSFAGNRWR